PTTPKQPGAETVHDLMVTSMKTSIDPRSYFLSASVDPTEARKATVRCFGRSRRTRLMPRRLPHSGQDRVNVRDAARFGPTRPCPLVGWGLGAGDHLRPGGPPPAVGRGVSGGRIRLGPRPRVPPVRSRAVG